MSVWGLFVFLLEFRIVASILITKVEEYLSINNLQLKFPQKEVENILSCSAEILTTLV